MGSIVQSIYDVALEFVFEPDYVLVDEDSINKVSEDIKEWLKRDEDPIVPFSISYNSRQAAKNIILFELLASAVNYCYWYGKGSIRIEGASATKMYKLLEEAFDEARLTCLLGTEQFHDNVVLAFSKKLSLARFPLVEKRINHLKEITKQSVEWFYCCLEHQVTTDEFLEYVISVYPGFSNDFFLKRAILFAMQLHRRGLRLLCDRSVEELPVAADYQLPKMLRHFGCIRYKPSLLKKIFKGILIPEGSQEECEIRAATIFACEALARRAGCSCERVDAYLWKRRNECDDPFHLTITTNY